MTFSPELAQRRHAYIITPFLALSHVHPTSPCAPLCLLWPIVTSELAAILNTNYFRRQMGGGVLLLVHPSIYLSPFFIDIDECLASPCNALASYSCNNTNGTYECTCKKGYEFDGVSCVGM